MIDNSCAILDFNQLFLKLNQFNYTRLPVLPDHKQELYLHDAC